MTTKHGIHQKSLSFTEREYAIQLLKNTQTKVFIATGGLNVTQTAFKTDTDKWSIEECVKHIAAAETILWAMAVASLKQAANAEKRAGTVFTDEELINAVEDRSQKSTTITALEPTNSPYNTMADALASFKQNREKLIAFVKDTNDDLRNHVSVTPIGTYDAYQFILLISAHCNRHIQQIEDVKSAKDFPVR